MTFTPSLATPHDYPAYARLFPELVVPEPTPSCDVFVGRFLPRVVMLRDESGEVVGYSAWNVFGSTFHVGNVVTAPEARRRGVGKALMDDLRARARDAGCTRWYLNVKQDNAVAIRLYERCGLTIEHEGWTLDVKWDALTSLPVTPHPARVFAPRPEDDVRLGERFRVDPARLARLREREGVVLRAIASDDVQGFAAFDPGFPGVYPIRVTRPEHARGLLDSFRSSARHDHAQVFVEADRALADALLAAGATLHFALFRMSGALTAPY